MEILTERPQLLHVRDAAKELGISLSSAYAEINSGRLLSVKIRGSRRVSRRAIAEYIDRLEQEAATG